MKYILLLMTDRTKLIDLIRSGNLNLAFNSKNAKEVVLFIEGITENGDFILDEKIIKIN